MTPDPEPEAGDQPRTWTKVQTEKLAREYAARLPGACPICGDSVDFVRERRGSFELLLIRCQTCDNSAEFAL